MNRILQIIVRTAAIASSLPIFEFHGTLAADIDFAKEVQPILAEHCWHCHGVDANDRKAGLRLDIRESAVTPVESGLAGIVPGAPEKSELIRRIKSHDPDLVMPPADQKKPLSEKQIKILSEWILQGAKYEAHWAFVPPVKSAIPEHGMSNPIDAFVMDRLKKEQLSPSPKAASAIVTRRAYLDLIGLPPTLAELSSAEGQSMESVVDSLLSSERFGEKWARHWLDLARYSDTNGYEKDLRREQWVWRDWVIDAFNRDLPYDQFLVQQIAGDLLPNPTQQQIIATGFLRNSMINEEGAIVPEQFRMAEMFDRIDCIGKAVLGLTTQCAQCHTHKFDPVTHDEYYGMFAFLNNSYEAQSWVYSPEQLKQLDDIQNRISNAEERIRNQRASWNAEVDAWADSIASQKIAWTALDAIELGSISGLNHPEQQADKSLLMKGHTSGDVFMIAAPALDGVTGLQLEALTHHDLPHNGPGRSSLGTFGIDELEVFVKVPNSFEWLRQKLVHATADFSEVERKQDDGKKLFGPVSYLIDGNDSTTWTADRGVGRRNQASVAVVQFETPLNYPSGAQIKIAWRNGGMLGCARFSITKETTPTAPGVDHSVMLATAIPQDQRTSKQADAVFEAWRRSVPDLKAINDEIDGLLKSQPVAATTVLHMKERESPNGRKTHLLDRGSWDRPLREIAPATPAAFHSFPDDAPRNRLGFAKWLTDRRSPLTARVAVNQIWQAMFGVGLVETSDDFGTRTPVPVYRELLDWLAVDFMEHGWSRKHLIRTIALSATYQQSSMASAQMLDRDPRNQLLARGARFRADAEVVRDIALTAAGLISHKTGGPGVIPPVPQNVLDYNYVYPDYWKPATGAERYRRTVYGFRKRSMPDPVMSNLDGPNGDVSCARRPRSNTPLAALTGLNETIFVEAARAMALRVLREGGANDSDRAVYAFRLCTSRTPDESERNEILELLKSRRQKIADGWLNPREIATGDPATVPDLPANATPQDAAAWTLVARVLLNLDETQSRN